MANNKRIATIILWTARIWGSISVAFLVFMFGAHLIGWLSGAEEFNSEVPIVSFLFFPISTIIGLSIAWKWPGLGGLITIGGLIGFHIIIPYNQRFVLIDYLTAPPGLLYLIYWFFSRSQKETK